ncbi:hypothetical protein BLA39750_01187 [Burkholderia lata]|uniref:Uncharacterized protein n=1 Tax=Burkholderia lata (strain ATCC 17760 / DSM 23089 / LMG 22485 / NCIMB 9086 / R18194 / 383) TaxID=482957 RepID=A0A6P2VAV7_BURL3|nr:hypothetical protein BLA39750_01187 [Burkholderia lata]
MTTLDDHKSSQRDVGPSDSRDGGQIRWLSFRMYQCALIVGVMLYLALDLDRRLAVGKVGFVLEGRHWIRGRLKDLDAVSNIEHLLFGLCCGFAGLLACHTLHYLDPAFASDSPRRSRRLNVRELVAQRLPKVDRWFRTTIRTVSRCVPSCASIVQLWRGSAVIRLCMRSAGSVAVVGVLLSLRDTAYSAFDIVPAIWFFAIGMWIVWGWGHLLRANLTNPEFVMLAFGFSAWFELDLAWKLVQLAHQKNTIAHAARHLTYSFGAFAVSVALFRLVIMRRWNLRFSLWRRQRAQVRPQVE